jgi:hypothetical protein
MIRDLEELILLLESAGIDRVDVLFGSGWGNWFLDYETLHIQPREIMDYLSKAETPPDVLGRHDLFVETRNPDCEIAYGHHSNIALQFNEFLPLAEEITRNWLAKDWSLRAFDWETKKHLPQDRISEWIGSR